MRQYELLLEFKNENFHTTKELAVIEDYLKSFNENNIDRLTQYASLGSTMRHRVMNMNAYNHNVLYGFMETELDKYGWLIRPTFETEVIEFPTTIDRSNPNIELGKGLNGKWSFGWSYSTGGNGSGCGVSAFRVPVSSRKEMFDYAIAHAQKWFTDGLNRNDSTNFNEALINQVLKSIEKIKIDQTQLQLF